MAFLWVDNDGQIELREREPTQEERQVMVDNGRAFVQQMCAEAFGHEKMREILEERDGRD